jgi:FMN phosphatase YigB (HAD superfamily)
MFRAATEALGVEPVDALMVSETASTDGGTASVGSDTLIVPRPNEVVLGAAM